MGKLEVKVSRGVNDSYQQAFGNSADAGTKVISELPKYCGLKLTLERRS